MLLGLQCFSTMYEYGPMIRHFFPQSGELSPSFAITHVRDALIAPVDRVALSSCWTEACQFIKNNETRIREETKLIKGEEYLVWR